MKSIDNMTSGDLAKLKIAAWARFWRNEAKSQTACLMKRIDTLTNKWASAWANRFGHEAHLLCPPPISARRHHFLIPQ